MCGINSHLQTTGLIILNIPDPTGQERLQIMITGGHVVERLTLSCSSSLMLIIDESIRKLPDPETPPVQDSSQSRHLSQLLLLRKQSIVELSTRGPFPPADMSACQKCGITHHHEHFVSQISQQAWHRFSMSSQLFHLGQSFSPSDSTAPLCEDSVGVFL
ncbi:hypothetical protein HPG69_016788 [Diceros bicornis minor]|uniref:Uncharacterized protein n=1 Tax=Diceros bicornis minor TaxID=77932 RepID=A0A7J7EBW7_DICBM|nr:hypothetical protein HPG69_016788 [Diceros bicornis minor]